MNEYAGYLRRLSMAFEPYQPQQDGGCSSTIIKGRS